MAEAKLAGESLPSLKSLKPWQVRKLVVSLLLVFTIGIGFLTYACLSLNADRMKQDDEWAEHIAESAELNSQIATLYPDAIQVHTGTYVENLKEISLKSSYFRLVMLVWFNWEGSPELDMANHFLVYKGYINRMTVVKEVHADNQNYQLCRVDVTVTKNFWTRRFPLESHQLRVYLEPDYVASEVVLIPDTENSTLNPSLSIAGYNISNFDTGMLVYQYENTRSDPELTEPVTKTEHLTAIELNRASWGLYAKCFIALFGTTLWVMITLYICTYHRVDPLGMIPAALFGTVSNIMVGANLLPDALEMGLLEYVNIWGIGTILSVAITVITINRIRNKYEDRAFAKLYGRIMFISLLVLVLAGHVLMPLSAFIIS